LILPVAVVVAGVVNYHTLRVRPYQLEVPRRSSESRQLTVVFAADFHLGNLTADRFLEKFVAKVNALNPDLVLIGGDVLEGHRAEEGTEKFAPPFRELRSKYGVYAVPGNHEGYGGNRDDFFARAGIKLLRDSVVKIDIVCYLVGRNDGRSRNRKSIEELLREVPDGLPVILLDHRPTDLERVSLNPVDIQLSGHTHHGQLFPINFVTKGRYELSWGYLKKRETHFFVTSGVQLWGPPVRTAGYSEILDIKVVFRDGGQEEN
jgi:predicted MPP superfamily phosphohydrolase